MFQFVKYKRNYTIEENMIYTLKMFFSILSKIL